MKKIAAILVVVIVGVVLWFLFGKGHEYSLEETRIAKRHTEKKPIQSDKEPYEERKRKHHENRQKVITQVIKHANVPIDFWGKVVDQNGEPLEGVKITYRIQQPRVMWDSNSIVKKISTDANGDFFITGDKGSCFGLKEFKKEGYRKTEGQRVSFTYVSSSDIYIPNKVKPKVYTMVKVDELPSLIQGKRWITLPWDGKPVYYNLKTGRYGQEGDIKIMALRGEIKGKGLEARFDWTFKVEVLGGGILETTRGEATIAPADGYKPFWEYGQRKTEDKWSYGKGTTHLCFKLKNGNYGRLQLRCSAEPDAIYSCNITSYLNPSGGRILEYDSRLKFKSKK